MIKNSRCLANAHENPGFRCINSALAILITSIIAFFEPDRHRNVGRGHRREGPSRLAQTKEVEVVDHEKKIT